MRSGRDLQRRFEQEADVVAQLDHPGIVGVFDRGSDVPRLTVTRPDLPPAVDSVIARAMAKRRDERFSSATEFTVAIRDVLEGRHIAAPTVWQPEYAVPVVDPRVLPMAHGNPWQRAPLGPEPPKGAAIFVGSGAVLMLCARTAGRVMSIITAVLAAALVACAASPSTGRWLRYRTALRTQRR
ncbi:hypothetical protein ACWF82_00715 [Nocardia sp. NPDC055053]